MLSETIISASHMLSPLWSEQIVKYFSLDYRYCTVFTLIFNGLSNAVSFTDQAVVFFIPFAVILFLIVKKYVKNFQLNLLKSDKGKLTILNAFNRDRETFVDTSNTYIEKFLYENQQFFVDPPKWITSDVAKINTRFEISRRGCFLDEGSYRVVVSEDLSFIVYSETDHGGDKKTSTHAISLAFHKGNQESLFTYMSNDAETKDDMKAVIFSYPQGVILAEQDIKEKKGKRSTFSGFYNPKLHMIIDWIDSLDKPSKHSQPRQFSIICHGSSGTGKTSIVKRIAEYTGRNIVIVNLFEVKKKRDLMRLFYCGPGVTPGGNDFFIADIDETIFFIDEFDKVVKKLKTLLEEHKTKKQDRMFLLLKGDDNGQTNTKDEDDNDIDWDIDDLLEFFCGSYIPDKRMIVVSCNDLNVITQEYPYLVRPGRLTPIQFNYGDKDLFMRICKDYADIDVESERVPDEYTFVQANLIEFLSYKTSITEEEIIENLELFRPAA